MGKPKKTRKRNYKALAIKLAKQIARERQPYCSKCGKPYPTVKLDAHHIMPVGYAKTAADLENLLVLCSNCHTMGRDAAHQNPLIFADWFNEVHPGKKDILWERAWAYSQNPFPKLDWEQIFVHLSEIKDSQKVAQK